MSACEVYDFDGTLTCRDTTRDLILALGSSYPLRGVAAAPRILRMPLARVNPVKLQHVKCRLLGMLLRGLTWADLVEPLARYRARVQPLLREELLARLTAQVESGQQPVILTASPRIAVESLFAGKPLSVIGSEFEMRSGHYTGRLLGSPCYGQAKVQALKRWLNQPGRPQSIAAAWSDSWSDAPVMLMAEERFWVCRRQSRADFEAKDPSGQFFIVN